MNIQVKRAEYLLSLSTTAVHCGSPYVVRVTIGNNSNTALGTGKLEVSLQGKTGGAAFTDIPAHGDHGFDVTLNGSVNCRQGLGPLEFKVTHRSGTILDASYHANSFKGTVNMIPTATAYLKSLEIYGICGVANDSNAMATFTQSSPFPVQARINMQWNGVNGPTNSVVVNPQQEGKIPFPYGPAISCATSGIPPLGYTYPTTTNPNTAGTLDAQTVWFVQ